MFTDRLRRMRHTIIWPALLGKFVTKYVSLLSHARKKHASLNMWIIITHALGSSSGESSYREGTVYLFGPTQCM